MSVSGYLEWYSQQFKSFMPPTERRSRRLFPNFIHDVSQLECILYFFSLLFCGDMSIDFLTCQFYIFPVEHFHYILNIFTVGGLIGKKCENWAAFCLRLYTKKKCNYNRRPIYFTSGTWTLDSIECAFNSISLEFIQI